MFTSEFEKVAKKLHWSQKTTKKAPKKKDDGDKVSEHKDDSTTIQMAELESDAQDYSRGY